VACAHVGLFACALLGPWATDAGTRTAHAHIGALVPRGPFPSRAAGLRDQSATPGGVRSADAGASAVLANKLALRAAVPLPLGRAGSQQGALALSGGWSAAGCALALHAHGVAPRLLRPLPQRAACPWGIVDALFDPWCADSSAPARLTHVGACSAVRPKALIAASLGYVLQALASAWPALARAGAIDARKWAGLGRARHQVRTAGVCDRSNAEPVLRLVSHTRGDGVPARPLGGSRLRVAQLLAGARLTCLPPTGNAVASHHLLLRVPAACERVRRAARVPHLGDSRVRRARIYIDRRILRSAKTAPARVSRACAHAAHAAGSGLRARASRARVDSTCA
jgi:hypothetical protein